MNGVRWGLKFCTIMFAMNWGMDYWVSYFFYSLSSPQQSWIPWRNIDREWPLWRHVNKRPQLTIPWERCHQTKIFELLLLGQIRWYPSFNCWPLPSLRTRRVKKLTDFFSKYAIIYPVYFNALYWKICITLLCSVFADPVTYM